MTQDQATQILKLTQEGVTKPTSIAKRLGLTAEDVRVFLRTHDGAA